MCMYICVCTCGGFAIRTYVSMLGHTVPLGHKVACLHLKRLTIHTHCGGGLNLAGDNREKGREGKGGATGDVYRDVLTMCLMCGKNFF